MDIFEQVAEIRVQERKCLFVQNLLRETDLPLEEIASLVEVSLEFVKEVKKDMRKKKK